MFSVSNMCFVYFVYFAYVMFLSAFVMFFMRTLQTREAVSLHSPTTSKYTLLHETLKYLIILKGVFAKNERGYRLNAMKKRF